MKVLGGVRLGIRNILDRSGSRYRFFFKFAIQVDTQIQIIKNEW